ncbi:MAG TPA: YkgJ family cysteine cluster protein [Kofleriaceae bacterium]|nr:YkgJ family cysteine cluster protein [Kofleriaceae bacterium]
MAGEHIYFTWPDRRLRYDCRGCGACCKGLGVGIDVVAGQLVQLVTRRPELAAFVRRRGDAVTAFNPRDRCWFLADDGLCRVEVEDGRAAKPASCRLFPFNRVFRAGAYTIVDYNSVICPLAVVASDGVSHAEVLAEIATIQDPAIVGTQLPPDDALFAREQAYAADLLARGADAIVADAVVNAAFDTILGTPWRAPAAPTLANALMLTPSLRFNELYGPRQYAPRDRMQSLLTRMQLAWLGFAALGEQLAQRTLGLQELTTLWSEQAPLMHAIARWDAVPVFKPGPVELPSVDPHNLVRTLGQRCVDNRNAKHTLGALVADVLTVADPATRVAALKMADPILRAVAWS